LKLKKIEFPIKESAGESYLKIANQIVGGKSVPQSQIPWQVYIYVDSKWLCGGTLIAPDWVLTAAYCVKGYNNFF